MRRALRWAGIVLAILVLLPLVLLAGILLALNTTAGQHEAERLLAGVLGPNIVVTGISGSIPAAPRVAHVELRDTKGVWLTADNIALDWSPLDLIHGVAKAELLTIGHASVARLPEPSASTPSKPGSSSFQLPVTVEVDAARLGRIDIAAPVVGTPLAATVDAQATLRSLWTGEGRATIKRLDGEGTYTADGRIDDSHITANLNVAEPDHGAIATIAGLPALGALTIHGAIDGPWNAVATNIAIAAGPAQAAAKGTVNVTGSAADLDVTANAPAMSPRSDVSWQSVGLDAHVQGPFARPVANGHARIESLTAAGAAIREIAADLQGDATRANLRATVSGVRIPGPKPDLLEAAPIVLTADARLDAPDRPVTFSLTHPLIDAKGSATTQGDIAANITLALPDLAPLASIGGVDLQGRTDLAIKASVAGATTHADVDGTVSITGGQSPIPRLVGNAAKIGVTAALTGSDVAVSRFQFDGSTAHLGATGGLTGGVVALDWTAALDDLALLAPTISGKLDGKGHVAGPTDNLSATADLTGDIGTKGFPRGPVTVALKADGLPTKPSGTVTATGTLDGSPLTLAANATRAPDGTLAVTIDRASWKSAEATGALSLAQGATLPLGHVTLKVERLSDFRTISGQPLDGSVEATANLAADTATLDLRAQNAGLPGTGATSATLTARVADPLGHPNVQALLAIDGLRAAGSAGNVRLNLDGPEDALALRLTTALQNFNGAPLQASATGTFDVPDMQLAIAALSATWRDETLRLLAPTRVSLKDGISVDQTRIGVGTAQIAVAGKLSPTLDLTASVRGVTPDIARAFVPDLQASGTLTADARLTGTPVRPEGTIRITANGLHMRTGPAASLPPANISANATLSGGTARIDTRLTAGRNQITVTGTAPLDPSGQLALHTAGAIDLTLLDPILTAQGRRVQGRVTLDVAVGGTIADPRANGTVRLAGGDVQDFVLGAHLTDVQALIEATGDTIRVASLTAHAGPGTITATGTVGLAAPTPVDLTITARNARPLASDHLTVSLNADLTLSGAVQQAMALAGLIHINTAEIRVPEKLPTQVATLNVIRPGQAPPSPPSPAATIGLNLTLEAPGQIFIRGRGLDAEVAGSLKIGGTTSAPQPSGSFHLVRGQYSIVGQTLTFSSGTVGFDGSGKIDPTLNFLITTYAASTTANLAITGYASSPKITLSSTPTLPQDEILSRILFGQSAASLGPFQLASIAAALAQISGVAPGGAFDALNSIRQGLGLDTLTVGSSNGGSGAAVQAGRYIAKGVYVGAQQSTSGGGTQATVQVDLLKGLKLQGTVGTGGSATGAGNTSNDGTTPSNGTSIGLTYQFEY